MTGPAGSKWGLPIVAPLIVLIAIGTFVDGFWTLHNIRSLLETVSRDGLLVIGMTIVMISGGFDLSVGAVLALAGVAGVMLIPTFGVYGSMLIATGLGACVGLANGMLITALRVNAFIATLAMMAMVRGGILAYTNTQSVSNFDEAFLALAGGYPVPYSFFLFLAVALAASVLMHTQPWGRHVYALGAGEQAARMTGLPVNRLKLQCYVLSGLLAGLAGYWIAARLGTGSPIIGEAAPLRSTAAALLGGVSLRGGEGTVLGACLGLLFVGCLVNIMMLLNIPSYFQRMAIGGLLLALVVSRVSLHRMWQR